MTGNQQEKSFLSFRHPLVPRDGLSEFAISLQRAAIDGDTKKMGELKESWEKCKERAELTQSNEFNFAMCASAFVGQLEAMNLCIQWGADDFDRALFAAAEGGYQKICDNLVGADAEAKVLDLGLCASARGGHIDLMNYFKGRGATDHPGALFNAARFGQVEAMKLAQQWGTGWDKAQYNKALILSAQSNNTDCVQICVDQWGADDLDSARRVAGAECQLATLHQLEQMIEKAKNAE